MHDNVLNESGTGLKNIRGTIDMARSQAPPSATRQFYFNMSDNTSLDPGSRNWGYSVFGEMVSGIEVLDAIQDLETGYNEDLDAEDVPLAQVTLIRASVIE